VLRRGAVRWILLLSLALPALFARAAEWTPTRSFRTFSKSSWRGLPQSSVVALAQSTDGVLWIGTLDGVATFDGKSITPVASVDAAPVRGLITTIVPRKRGGVYVASQAGVHLFDGTSWRLIPSKRGAASLAESRDGTLWMVDSDGVLWTLDHDQWQPRKETNKAVAVAAASDGATWIATDFGAARISDGRLDPVLGDPLPSRPAAILVASDGRVWIATQSCTVHWTRGGADGWHQAAFEPWPRGAFRCLAEDRRGRIWAGSVGGHVAFGNATMPWTVWGTANGPFEAGVMSILGDREGSVWFGLNAVGLTQWVGEAWSHRSTLDPGSSSRALFSAFGLSRAATSRDLLVGVFQVGGLRLSENSMRQYAAADGITEDVRSFVEADDGTLIAGTRFGIFESQSNKPFRQVLKIASGFVIGLFRSPTRVWYAATTNEGVFVRDANGWRPDAAINASLDNKHVRGMMWRRNGELWIATLRGITTFRDGKLVARLTSRDDRAIPESVNALLEISDDEVWAGGTGGLAIRRGSLWTKMSESDGLPGQTIYSLARGRDGAIWAGGSAGVGRFANGVWTVWDSRSGLLQEECNLNGLVVDDDGSVYAGTMSGLARFDPSVPALPRPPLEVRWLSAPTKLANGERALHLRWSAPWLDPHPVQYRVRVPRLRDEWSAPSYEDHLDIENLGAGPWHVEVSARVEGTSGWSKPLALDVDVAPFWYETLPARIAMIALLGLLVYIAVRLRVRALRRHADMLEATVRERTAELAEKVEQLHDSEQRALAASHAKSAFLANMSHELRTPLNGILGFAQLLARRKNRDADDQQGLHVIVNSGEHLLGLINNVLSLSKIEAGRITLEETRFDIRTIVREVENVLRLRAEEKRIRFTTVIEEMPDAVIGDEVRVRQILLNLAGNAVKFTETGGVTLRAKWRDDRATFEVEDTGPGIAADELLRLFEPFVQSESGRQSKEGTGLGLALSRNLARLMSGDITVESTPGRGSLFRVDVSLPHASALVPATDDRRVTSLVAADRGARILVVDDTAINRMVLTRLLTEVGFAVKEATSGEEALAAWRSWKPRLIWMDKRMSDLDGLEVTRRIRAEEKATGAARTPIIALSASALDHERGDMFAAGCDDFVAKPFRDSTIFAKLREHIGVQYEYASDEPVAITKPVAVHAQTDAQVLLVDDDWICREVATEILRSNGVGVTAVASGSDALTLLEVKHFDLVLMDLHMPNMSGIEAARRIKANPHTSRLPVIAMSADTFDGESARLTETGMDDHVPKPVEPETLTAVVGRWLPARRDA